MISALGNEHEMNRAKEAGVDRFLTKPIRQSNLFDTIMEIHGYEPLRSRDFVKRSDRFESFPDTHLLLVEDNAVNQMVVVEMLQLPGITMDLAENGNEAIELVSRNNYDVILMDVQMPEMDGIETTRIIRNKLGNKDVPIIALTAHAMYGDREKCIASGMNDYIPKPVDRDRLLSILKLHLKSAAPVSGEYLSMDLTLPGPSFAHGTTVLPGIDLDEGLKRFGDSWTRYMKILLSFSHSFIDFSETVTRLIKGGHLGEAVIQVHSLKGTAGNISANRLYIAAEAFEKALREKNVNDIGKQFMRVDDELRIVLESINRVTFNETPPEDTMEEDTGIETASFNPDRILEIIPDLFETLKDFDPVESENKLEEIKCCFYENIHNHDLDSLIQDLETHVKNYQFDEAIEVLVNLDGQLKVLETGHSEISM
jgi:CheY-like chemotaxis protein/HPt (histidine-containing phosphotransfer) domain-containing protein